MLITLLKPYTSGVLSKLELRSYCIHKNKIKSRSVVVKNLYREYMKYRRVKNLSPIVPIVSPINCQKV